MPLGIGVPSQMSLFLACEALLLLSLLFQCHSFHLKVLLSFLFCGCHLHKLHADLHLLLLEHFRFGEDLWRDVQVVSVDVSQQSSLRFTYVLFELVSVQILEGDQVLLVGRREPESKERTNAQRRGENR